MWIPALSRYMVPTVRGTSRPCPCPVEFTFQWRVRRRDRQMCKQLSKIIPDEYYEENKNGM